MLAATAPELDWAGQWIAAPHGRLPNLEVGLAWLTLGAQRGQFDDWHPLLMLGMEEGQLATRAYIWHEGQAVAIGGPLNALRPE